MKLRNDPPINGWWVDTVYDGRDVVAVVIDEDGSVWGVNFSEIEVTR